MHGSAKTETKAHAKTSPSELLRRFYYDALIHDPRPLRYLIDLVGADRIAIGTDAPFDMGEEAPAAMIEKVRRLTGKERDQIFGGTALELLGNT